MEWNGKFTLVLKIKINASKILQKIQKIMENTYMDVKKVS